MSKLLIHTDTTKAQAEANAYGKAKARLQLILDQYNALGLPALTAQEFPSLFTNTAELVFDKMTDGEPVSISGITVNKAKAMEIVNKPAGYEGMTLAIAQLAKDAIDPGFNSDNAHARVTFHLSGIPTLFVLANATTVGYTPYAQGNIDEAGKTYVESDRAKAVHAFVTDVATAFFANGLEQWFQESWSQGRPIGAILATALDRLDYQNQTFRVNYSDLVAQFDRQR